MIGFIGGGNMAEAMIKGMTLEGMKDILVSEPRPERRQELERLYGVKSTGSNREVAGSCSVVVLAVKPQQMPAVLDEISGDVDAETTVVSIAAGVTLATLQAKLRSRRIVRVMPNTPALLQEGMSVMSLCECFTGKEIETVRNILMSVGRVLTLPESRMNAVTALSGSGPAFIALFAEAMIDSGEWMGLSRQDATELIVQTLTGTAKLLDSGMSPERLRQMVTSPGGTTAAGLAVFERKGLRQVVAEALEAARNRAEELGKS
ncbi:MAG: pyrroline-5-carboxylate reductase [Thermodesulfovibrionales bacterium]